MAVTEPVVAIFAFRDLFLPLEDGRKKQGRNRKSIPDHVCLPLQPMCFWKEPPFPSLSFLPIPSPPTTSALHFFTYSSLPNSFWHPPCCNMAHDERQHASTHTHTHPLPFTSALSTTNVESQPCLSLCRLFVHLGRRGERWPPVPCLSLPRTPPVQKSTGTPFSFIFW